MIMIDGDNNDDSDRTESYTPPPLDITNDLTYSSEKENSRPIKHDSIIILDESFDQKQIDTEPTSKFIFVNLMTSFFLFRCELLGSMAIR